MGISEIEAVEHSLRQILGEPIPDDLFREVSEEVESGTLLGCVAQAPSIRSLGDSLSYLRTNVRARIEEEGDDEERQYLEAIDDELERLEKAFEEATRPLIEFLQERVVRDHARFHRRFPTHSHDA